MTGLKVNWFKLQLLAIDADAKRVAPIALQLQWVDEFTYLGVHILRVVADFISLNLCPVAISVKAMLKSWENLPLSLLGCINLIKTKI